MTPNHSGSSPLQLPKQLEVFARELNKLIVEETGSKERCVLATGVGLKTAEKLGLQGGEPLPLRGLVFRLDCYVKFLTGERNFQSGGLVRLGPEYKSGQQPAPHDKGHIAMKFQDWLVDGTLGQTSRTQWNLIVPETLVAKLPPTFEAEGILLSTDPANPLAPRAAFERDPHFKFTEFEDWKDTETIDRLADVLSERVRAVWLDFGIEMPEVRTTEHISGNEKHDSEAPSSTTGPREVAMSRRPTRRGPLYLETSTRPLDGPGHQEATSSPSLLAGPHNDRGASSEASTQQGLSDEANKIPLGEVDEPIESPLPDRSGPDLAS